MTAMLGVITLKNKLPLLGDKMKLTEINVAKQIRRKNWDAGIFILSSGPNQLFDTLWNTTYGFAPDDLFADDWEYYQEIKQEKKKVKKWLWRYKDTSCWLVDYQYMDDVQMVSKGRVTDRNYEKLLWSEIEVEE
jgi:hypothetical protein